MERISSGDKHYIRPERFTMKRTESSTCSGSTKCVSISDGAVLHTLYDGGCCNISLCLTLVLCMFLDVRRDDNTAVVSFSYL